MIQTAIIAILLIGAMFIFTECGDSETEEVAKIEVDKEGVPKYVTAKSHDKSYDERDKEISAASYLDDEKKEADMISSDKSSIKYSLATKDGTHGTIISDKKRDAEIALASYGKKGMVEATVLTDVKSEKKVVVIEKTEVIDTPKVAVAVATAAVAVTASKVVVPLVSKMVVPEANMTVVTAEPVPKIKPVVDATQQEITVPAVPNVPEVNITIPTALKSKSIEEFASNSQAKKDLNAQRNANDEEIAKNALLSKQLEEKTESEKKLKSTNQELGLKIDELLLIAKEATLKAETKYAEGTKEVQGLLSDKESLKVNLTAELENEKKLQMTNDELSAKISDLLLIAKEGTKKAEEENTASVSKMQGLLSTKESLEANLTSEQEHEKLLTEENIGLQAKIAELLNIAKEGTEKATAAQEAEKEKMQGLLSTKESLEGNVSKLKATNNELATKISELLVIAEEGTKKAEEENTASVSKMQGLLSTKESLEANLTSEQEHEKLLAEENVGLNAKIADLLNIAKEDTKKATAEQEAKESKMQELLSAKESLEANLTAELDKEKLLAEENVGLNAKIADLLNIAKEDTKKATAEQEAKESKMQELLSAKESLEANATQLKTTNDELSAKISELLSIAEEGTNKAEAENTASVSEMQGLLSTKESLEANLTSELEHEKLLAEENAKLKEQLEAQKAELEAKAKEEAERLAAEKEAETKAAEEKAAAEAAKAKEEAERLAAEKEAEAKEAEKKLTDAFSLTKVEFKTGSTQLTSESKKRLNKAATVMKNYEGYSYKIQGHTDNRGNESFNKVLSGKRAKAVKAYLVSQGVDAGILSTEGFGSAQPIASNDTREGRVQNRRVVFEIIK